MEKSNISTVEKISVDAEIGSTFFQVASLCDHLEKGSV